MPHVFLVTTGSGDDGDAWAVDGVFTSERDAEEYKAGYEMPRHRPDGSSYTLTARIEIMGLDPVYEVRDDQKSVEASP